MKILIELISLERVSLSSKVTIKKQSYRTRWINIYCCENARQEFTRIWSSRTHVQGKSFLEQSKWILVPRYVWELYLMYLPKLPWYYLWTMYYRYDLPYNTIYLITSMGTYSRCFILSHKNTIQIGLEPRDSYPLSRDGIIFI